MTAGGPAPTTILSVVFTDLVDSTRVLSSLDEQSADRLLTHHFDVLRRCTASHGGQEIKTTGDGLMLTFTSVTSAVLWAVAAQRAIQEDNRRRRREPMHVRIGISVGEVTLRDGDLFGSPAVEASRLCAAAKADEILTADVVRMLIAAMSPTPFVDRGELELRGLPGALRVAEVAWERDTDREVRAVLADDSVLFREGVARLLEEHGVRVVAQARDLTELLECVETHQPELTVTDVRMPPTQSTEGLQAAERIRAEHPEISVLLLSNHVEPAYALRLAAQGGTGFGYLLKERVTDVEQFGRLARRVATGGTAIDAEVIDTLIARQRRRGRLSVLTDNELVLLRGLAQGEEREELAAAAGIETGAVPAAVSAMLQRLEVPGVERAEPVTAALGVLADYWLGAAGV